MNNKDLNHGDLVYISSYSSEIAAVSFICCSNVKLVEKYYSDAYSSISHIDIELPAYCVFLKREIIAESYKLPINRNKQIECIFFLYEEKIVVYTDYVENNFLIKIKKISP